jgi:hypothetical protein
MSACPNAARQSPGALVRFWVLQESLWVETGVGWKSSRAQWEGDRVAEELAALRTARLAAVLNEVLGLADCDEGCRVGLHT